LRAVRKAFFFEEKKQKDNIEPIGAEAEKWFRLARNQTDKSFLVLFFKKEHASYISMPGRLCPRQTTRIHPAPGPLPDRPGGR
jgi:hypothetical protein